MVPSKSSWSTSYNLHSSSQGVQPVCEQCLRPGLATSKGSYFVGDVFSPQHLPSLIAVLARFEMKLPASRKLGWSACRTKSPLPYGPKKCELRWIRFSSHLNFTHSSKRRIGRSSSSMTKLPSHTLVEQ